MVYFSSHLDTRDNMKHHFLFYVSFTLQKRAKSDFKRIFLSVNKSINHHLVFQ